jgi:hypothetical protein
MEVLLKQAEEAKVAGVDVCSSGADTSFREECRRLSDENLRLKREHCDSLADNQRLKQVVSALEGELAAAASSNEQSKRVIQGLQSDAGLAAHTIRTLEDALHVSVEFYTPIALSCDWSVPSGRDSTADRDPGRS